MMIYKRNNFIQLYWQIESNESNDAKRTNSSYNMIVFMTIRGLSFFTGMGAMILVGGHLRKKMGFTGFKKICPHPSATCRKCAPLKISASPAINNEQSLRWVYSHTIYIIILAQTFWWYNIAMKFGIKSENKPHTQNTSNQHSAGTKYCSPFRFECLLYTHIAVKCAPLSWLYISWTIHHPVTHENVNSNISFNQKPKKHIFLRSLIDLWVYTYINCILAA